MAYPVELAQLFVELVAIQADGVVRLVDANLSRSPAVAGPTFGIV